MPLCSAYSCHNKGVHTFPSDEERRKLWIKALRRKNWKPNSSARICSSHFKPEDFCEASIYTGFKHQRKILKRDVVPSIFSFTKNKNLVPHRQPSSIPKSVIVKNPESGRIKWVRETDVAPCVSEKRDLLKTALDMALQPSVDRSCQVNMTDIYGTVSNFQTDDKAILFYTGFETYDKFCLVYSTLSLMASKFPFEGYQALHLSFRDQFFLTLMKLRQNKTTFELSRFFHVTCSTVSKIFINWINLMFQLWNEIHIWPSLDLVKSYMPDTFKKNAFQVIPVFNKAKSQAYLNLSYNPPRKNVSIERLIELSKMYNILKSDLNHIYVPHATKIFYVCIMCCKFREELVNTEINI